MNTGQPQTDPAFSSPQGLPGPAALSAQTALSAAAARTAAENRSTILSILQGRDRRLLVIIGPCSVHDPAEALDYARWLLPFARRMQDRMLIAMRCYVEKSLTGAGWRGLARQPLPTGILASGADGGIAALPEIAQPGIKAARAFLVQVAELGLPVAVEMVSPFLWPYWSDCVSWASAGARGVESQALREAASALPCACGFKNATDGSIDTALHAIQTAALPGPVLALHPEAADSTLYELHSRGNPCPHLILRGGRQGPNLAAASQHPELPENLPLIVDASHANSGFNPARQTELVQQAIELRRSNGTIRGIMIESYLRTGSQSLPEKCWQGTPTQRLQTGLSITDPCLGQDESAQLLETLYRQLAF